MRESKSSNVSSSKLDTDLGSWREEELYPRSKNIIFSRRFLEELALLLKDGRCVSTSVPVATKLLDSKTAKRLSMGFGWRFLAGILVDDDKFESGEH